MFITRYGLPQALLFPLAAAAPAAALALAAPRAPWLPAALAPCAALSVWALSFFRDPPRRPPRDDAALLSPADGTVTDAAFVSESPLGGSAVKIGIFLSLFDVHINRSPCRAAVETVAYRRGAAVSALSPDAGRVNESNNVTLRRLTAPASGSRVLVRQISGAIARRIVCEAAPGGELAQGEPFGMIKFGSRTEVYAECPDPERMEIAVRPGERVKAGLSVLARYADGN